MGFVKPSIWYFCWAVRGFHTHTFWINGLENGFQSGVQDTTPPTCFVRCFWGSRQNRMSILVFCGTKFLLDPKQKPKFVAVYRPICLKEGPLREKVWEPSVCVNRFARRFLIFPFSALGGNKTDIFLEWQMPLWKLLYKNVMSMRQSCYYLFTWRAAA